MNLAIDIVLHAGRSAVDVELYTLLTMFSRASRSAARKASVPGGAFCRAAGTVARSSWPTSIAAERGERSSAVRCLIGFSVLNAEGLRRMAIGKLVGDDDRTNRNGAECLRITPSPHHTGELSDRLAAALVDVWDHLKLSRLEVTSDVG
jgi:hypothetical protein